MNHFLRMKSLFLDEMEIYAPRIALAILIVLFLGMEMAIIRETGSYLLRPATQMEIGNKVKLLGQDAVIVDVPSVTEYTVIVKESWGMSRKTIPRLAVDTILASGTVEADKGSK